MQEANELPSRIKGVATRVVIVRTKTAHVLAIATASKCQLLYIVVSPLSCLFIKPTYNFLYLSTSLLFLSLEIISFAVAVMAVIIKDFASIAIRVAPLLFRMIFGMVEAGQSVRRTRTVMVIWSALTSVVIRWMLLPL